MVNFPVLVLNVGYEPLNVCRVRRAIVLIEENKAEMLENGSGFIRSANRIFAIPSVIRIATMVRRPNRNYRKLTRMEVFRRDQYTCQYCGKKVKQLTLDHVIPRYRGGQHTWENVVSACVSCNRNKAGRTPKEAGINSPDLPPLPRTVVSLLTTIMAVRFGKEWQKYLPSVS